MFVWGVWVLRVLCVCVCLPADIDVMGPFKQSVMCDPKLKYFHISLRAFSFGATFSRRAHVRWHLVEEVRRQRLGLGFIAQPHNKCRRRAYLLIIPLLGLGLGLGFG